MASSWSSAVIPIGPAGVAVGLVDRPGLAAERPEPLAQERVKQNRFDAGMAPDGANELAVPVEADGLPNQALHVVGHERAEPFVDLVTDRSSLVFHWVTGQREQNRNSGNSHLCVHSHC